VVGGDFRRSSSVICYRQMVLEEGVLDDMFCSQHQRLHTAAKVLIEL
jgi:hypothetical protein